MLPVVKQPSGQADGGTAKAGWHRQGSLQLSLQYIISQIVDNSFYSMDIHKRLIVLFLLHSSLSMSVELLNSKITLPAVLLLCSYLLKSSNNTIHHKTDLNIGGSPFLIVTKNSLRNAVAWYIANSLIDLIIYFMCM